MADRSATTVTTAPSSGSVINPAETRRRWLGAFWRLIVELGQRIRPGARIPKAAGEHIRLTNPWHAVSIAAAKGCCQASIDLKDRRFLSSEAPRLPLAGCTSPAHCACVYKHFSDRREGPRRSEEQDIYERGYSAPAAKSQSQERRGSRGRRDTDGSDGT